MKKILLTLALSASVLLGKSQIVVLNEIYTDPGAGNSEFFELYNSSGFPLNTDCYTVITYFTEGANTGFYVMDLPDGFVQPAGFYVGAAAGPDLTFSVQGTPGAVANFSWNNIPVTGSLTKWVRNGAAYTKDLTFDPTTFNDFFQTQTGSGAAYHVLVYANGILVNAFFGGTSTTVIPAAIRAMPDLPVDMLGACSDFTARFDAGNLPDIRGEYVTPTPGHDNGYIRKKDGQCGEWDKGAPGVNHTPGSTNGAADASGLLTVSASLTCAGAADSTLTLNYSVEGGGPVEAYPVRIVIFEDRGRTDPGTTPNVFENELPNGVLDPSDTVVHIDSNILIGGSGPLSFLVDPIVSPNAYIFPFPNNERESRSFILVFQTPQGCYDQVRIPAPCIILPVEYKSFVATRNHSNVLLKWETATEQNSDGFAVQRNIGGVWEEIAYIPSQAASGSSYEVLTYTYNDVNNNRGITQYRIKQVDFDGRNKDSEIRAVRGEGQNGRTIVYPNPSSNGKVNVVFEETNVIRDVTLFDMSGRAVKQWRAITNNNIQIDNLTPGIYSLRILATETGEQSVEKIVVNKR